MVHNTQLLSHAGGSRGGLGCLTNIDLTNVDFHVNACQPFAVIELSEQTIIDQVADRLTSKYPTIPAETVTAVVRGVHARFDGRPVREYVPLLVERFSGQELGLLLLTGRRPISETTVDQAIAV
jgi:hypothetical protein